MKLAEGAPQITAPISRRYSEKHKMRRVLPPRDMQPLQKVRLYRRGERRWTCQWWERKEKKNVSHSLEGDFIDALAAAREIDQRLVATRASGHIGGKVKHGRMLERYRQELQGRADADELEISTVRRYQPPLDYYQRFVLQPHVERRYPHALSIDRDRSFVCALMSFVKRNPIGDRPADPQYVCDVVRGMYRWAQDPDGGNLLPDYFRSPFSAKGSATRKTVPDLLGEPDITLNMAVDLIGACDLYQLRLFAPMVLLGLRPSELCFLFHDDLDHHWLRVPCNLDIGYKSKGKRDKRFPLFEPLTTLLKRTVTRSGLLYLRRAVAEGCEEPKLLGISLERFSKHYAVRTSRLSGAAQRRAVRDGIFFEAGGVDYHRIEGEFQMLRRKLNWPAAATMKDLRHLFATSLAAGMPEHDRQYFRGQTPTSAPIGRYTHLNELPRPFLTAARQAFASLRDAISKRLGEISVAAKAA